MFKLNAKSASILIIAGAAMCGLLGPINRILQESHINYFAISFYRAGLTAAILLVVILIVNRGLLKVKKEHILLFIILGLCKGTMDTSYSHSFMEISLSLSTVLQMTAPFFLILFSAAIFKEKITKRKVIAVLLGLAATCMISDVFANQGNISLFGVLLGLVSGITYAGYMMCTAILIDKKYHVLTILFYAFLIPVILNMPTAPIVNTVDYLIQQPSLFGYLIVIAVGCTIFPYFVDSIGMKYVSVTAVTMLSMVEIAVSAIMGFIMYDEPLTAITIIGMFVLAAALLLISEKKEDNGDDASASAKEGPPET